MYERFLTWLADRMGVSSAQAGEVLTPRIQFEQPWPQWLAVVLFFACAAVIIALYRREGKAPMGYKMFLAGLRISLVALAMLMLSEAVLSVERTGLPYCVIMVDDSASQGITDQYLDETTRTAVKKLLPDRPEPPRIEISKALLQNGDAEWITRLKDQHKVRLYLTSSATRPLAGVETAEEIPPTLEKIRAVEASGVQTRLGDGIKQVLTELRGGQPNALIILTDGQNTGGDSLESAAEFARRKGVPLFFVGIGDPEPARDLELTELLVDEVAFVKDTIPFQVKLLARGYEGENVTLRLLEKPTGGGTPKELGKKVVKAPRDGVPLPVEITHQPQTTGAITYVIELDALPRELQAENNRIERLVNVRKEKLKVLIAEGQPRYEFRYLKNFLERQSETVDLSVVLLSSDPEYSEQDRSALPTFPTSKDDLFKYDVVILGDVDPTFFSSGQIANLVEFVTVKGGGLLFVAGPFFNPLTFRGTPLESLLPVELESARDPSIGQAIPSFRPELTVEGRGHPIFRFGSDEITSLQIWETLPELLWYMETPRKKPAAIVLAELPRAGGAKPDAAAGSTKSSASPSVGAERIPLILYQFVGAGKTMFHAVDDTWRWRYRVGDEFFGKFWMQEIRFLARSKLLGQKQAEVSTDRLRYQRNQPVQIKVRFPNPARAVGLKDVNVQVERIGQGSRKLTLGQVPGTTNLFEGALPQAQEGEYEIKLLPPPVLEGQIPTARFKIEPPAGELEQVQMNQSELIRAAKTSDGKFLPLAEAATLLDQLPQSKKIPLDTDPPVPLWNTWPLLAAFLTLITLEWFLRKRMQMA